MSTAPTAAPAAPAQQAPAASPMETATEEILKTLPGQQPESDLEEDDGSDLPQEDQTKEQKRVAEEKRKYKLKVSGKDLEVDEAELLKRAQMGYSADEKWQEAAKMRKQLEGFVNFLQKDPAAALSKLGFNIDELAEKHIEKRIEEMKKSPEQLELERLRSEREELMAEREREKGEFQERELKRMQDEFAVNIENEITSAIDSPEFGLPKSPYYVKRIADVLIWAHKNNKEMSAADAAKIVKAESKKEWQEMYKAIDSDDLFEDLVGKDRLTRYRRGKVKKKTSTPNSTVKATGQAELKNMTEDKPKQKQNMKDFFRNLGNK